MFSGDLTYIQPPKRRASGKTVTIEMRNWPDTDKGKLANASEHNSTTERMKQFVRMVFNVQRGGKLD